MYKRIKGKKFSRKTDQRRAFLRSLAVNLIMEERITTTKTRARAASTLTEKMITLAKKGNLAAIKKLSSMLPQVAVKKLITGIAPRFTERTGGYTRIMKLGQRYKDGAEMAVAEFVDRDEILAKEKAEKTKKPADKKKAAKKEKKAKADTKKKTKEAKKQEGVEKE
jgi:large subunit ribosomal protein L17